MGIGKVLARHLMKAGRSVSEVARSAGVKTSTLQSIIDRDSGSSTLHLVQVTRALGLTVEELYEEAGLLEPAVRPISTALAREIDKLDAAGIDAVQRAVFGQQMRMAAEDPAGTLEHDAARRKKNIPALPASGFRELSYSAVADIRGQVYYLRVLVPGLAEDAVPGDILVVAGQTPTAIGETGVFKWDGTHYVCVRQEDSLLVNGEKPWARPITLPFEQLGKVVGKLRM